MISIPIIDQVKIRDRWISVHLDLPFGGLGVSVASNAVLIHPTPWLTITLDK